MQKLHPEPETWRRPALAIGIAAVAIGIAVIAFYYATPPAPPAATPPIGQAPVPKAASAEPAIRYPVELQSPEKELPELNASDASVREALASLWGERALELFHLDGLIRRVVATIDNLPREKVALRLMPVKRTPGTFRTLGKDAEVVAGPDNAARYRRYVQLANAIDGRKLVAVYVRFYPLFQHAYQDLGYPERYFNDRVVEVIDHLLEAPDVPAGTQLIQRKVLYEFVDPDLEARSAGQKILMRIGNENAASTKAKLREIRSELIRAGGR